HARLDPLVLLPREQDAEVEHRVPLRRRGVTLIADGVERRAGFEDLTNASVREFGIAAPAVDLVADHEVALAHLRHERAHLLAPLLLLTDATLRLDVEHWVGEAMRTRVR